MFFLPVEAPHLSALALFILDFRCTFLRQLAPFSRSSGSRCWISW